VQGSEALNLEQALRIFRRRVPLIVFCVVVVAGAAFAFSKHQTKKYTATGSLAFNSNSLSQQIAGLPASSEASPLVQQASNVELVRLGDMAAKTARMLGRGLTEEKVGESLSVSGQGESSVVAVSSTMSSPVLSAAIVNTYVRLFVQEQQVAKQRYFRSALALVKTQLGDLSREQRLGQDGLALQNRAQTLRLLSDLKYGNVQVAQQALVPSSPSSPRPARNTVLGALLGLLIGVGLALVLEHLDRRIKAPQDLEGLYRAPLLGVIPESTALLRLAGQKKGARKALPAPEAEAFHLIRSHLRFFNVDRELCTVLIASPAPGDGKTTIARHLAEAATRMGSRVLLIEADLRHPTLAEQLVIERGPGLTDVLIGECRLDEATQAVGVLTTAGEGSSSRTLDVLVSGAVPPPNPGELIESYAMGNVVARAKSTYDLVVIDTPPLTAVSDAFPLLTKVDGVVIVGRVGHSRRDVAERLHQVLASSDASVLGVIANGGSKESGPGPYAYPSGESPPPSIPLTSDASSHSEPSPTANPS
jgi:polysaccharide biosynthesis transport protein